MRPVLERPQARLIGEKEAFRAAMDGESLATALGILIRTSVEEPERDEATGEVRVQT